MNSSEVLRFNVSDFLPAVYRPPNFNQQKHQPARVAREGQKGADNARVCVLPDSLNLYKSAEEWKHSEIITLSLHINCSLNQCEWFYFCVAGRL